MKFVHLSDLHLGKRVNEFSMIEDQKYILLQIVNIIDEQKPDGVLIAGDIFDKSVPSEEAVCLWDDFLNMLAARKLRVFVISGNHDSAIRLADHSELVDMAGIHFSPVYDGNVKCFVLKAGEETVNIYMLPFIKPAVVRSFFPDEEISWAVKYFLDALALKERLEFEKQAPTFMDNIDENDGRYCLIKKCMLVDLLDN